MLRSATLACGLIALTGAANATVLFSQSFDGVGSAYASQDDTIAYGNFGTVYDNFTLSDAASATEISWTGGFFNPGTTGQIEAYTVSLYSDAAGQPGALLYQTHPPGAANQAFLGVFSGAPIFTYSAAVDVALAARTQYWLSIVPDLGYPPQWGWGTSTVGDALSFQDFFGMRSQLETDFAFTISGESAVFSASAIPELTTWAMLALGLASLGFGRYRRTPRSALNI